MPIPHAGAGFGLRFSSSRLWAVVFILLCLCCCCHAQLVAVGADEADQYDKGFFGIYPEVRYRSTDLVSPRPLFRKWGKQCRSPDDYFFFSPHGNLVTQQGPIIMDTNGSLVWHHKGFSVAYGLTVQQWRGDNYITFWSGNDQVIGHGQGSYYMMDKHYNNVKKINARAPLSGDLHEFKITKQGTGLLTSYFSVKWDLTAFGHSNESYVWDCFFQELDLDTGDMLFMWRATDHFRFEDCYNPVRDTGAVNNPWDWFHINSVDKDDDGHYIISSRYTHGVHKLDRVTGDIIWNLGGKLNNFKDLSDGRATSFSWQHDARWSDDFKTLTLFDNSAYFADQRIPARGLKLMVDQKNMEVRVVTEAKHPSNYVAESQGSAQSLSNHNLFLGYGSVPAFAEFDSNGMVVCDAQYGATHFHKDHSFSGGAVMSYRTYKHKWVGLPLQEPEVKFTEENDVYVSWNGDTETRLWKVEGTNSWGSSEADWRPVGQAQRNGFETKIRIESKTKSWRMFRMTALNAEGSTLGLWVVYSGGLVKSMPYPEDPRVKNVALILFGSLVTLSVTFLFWKIPGYKRKVYNWLENVSDTDGSEETSIPHSPVLHSQHHFRPDSRDSDDVERSALIREANVSANTIGRPPIRGENLPARPMAAWYGSRIQQRTSFERASSFET